MPSDSAIPVYIMFCRHETVLSQRPQPCQKVWFLDPGWQRCAGRSGDGFLQCGSRHFQVGFGIGRGGLDVRVSEERLDDRQRVSRLKQMHCFTVPERVGRDPFVPIAPARISGSRVLAHDVPNAGAGQLSLLAVAEQRPVCAFRSFIPQIGAEESNRTSANNSSTNS